MNRSDSRILRLDGGYARLLAVVTTAAFLSATCGVSHTWKPKPLTEVSRGEHDLPDRSIRVETSTGPVVLHVTSVIYPFVEGRAQPGDGEVLFDVRKASRAEAVSFGPRQESTRVLASTAEQIQQAAFVGETVRFETATGFVVLHATGYEYPLVRGTPGPCPSELGEDEACPGPVRLDLREARSLEVRELSSAGTAGRYLLFVGLVAGALLLILGLTKELCPFVYVDHGEGLELVGEAYAGAAFRSLQRDDLLPLPSSPGRRYRVVLRNEARQTQHTDRAELMVVEHPPSARALSTFDGGWVLVGPGVAPTEAHDGERDVAEAIRLADGRLWERGVVPAAWSPEAPSRDVVRARFTPLRPQSQGVLTIVAANTPWLDLVLGRFFAATGDRLATYQGQWDAPAAGPKLRAWKDREGIDLRVEVRAGGDWIPAAVVPTIGPLALREVAVPLPTEGLVANHPLEVRISGGGGFWRIDQVALAERLTASVVVHRVRPTRATGADGSDGRARVVATDSRYDVLERINDSLELDFELPPPAPDTRRSIFLDSNGYYAVHPPLDGDHSPGTVEALLDEPGAFARFSRGLATEYLRLWRDTPRVAVGRP